MNQYLEVKNVAPTGLITFDRNPSSQPHLIKNYKIKVLLKLTLHDATGMERMLNVFGGEVKGSVEFIQATYILSNLSQMFNRRN